MRTLLLLLALIQATHSMTKQTKINHSKVVQGITIAMNGGIK